MGWPVLPLRAIAGLTATLLLLTGCSLTGDKDAPPEERATDERAYRENTVRSLPGRSGESSSQRPDQRRDRRQEAPLNLGPDALSTELASQGAGQAPGLEPLIVRGQSRYRRRPAPRLAEPARAGRTIVLNFDKVEVKEVARVVLGELLGVNYTVDPSISGTIDMKSTEPVPVSAALGILETVLKQNDASLVVDGTIYRILPEDQAPYFSPVPALVSDGRPIPPGYSVRVVPLNFIGAEEMAEILQPFTEESGVLRVDPERNLIVLAGMSRDLQQWLETVNTFDVDWFSGKSVGIFPLSEVSADNVIDELRAIFDRTEDAGPGVIEFLPIERLNAVMVIAVNGGLVERVQSWVDRLDRGSPSGRRLFVYRMRNAKAADLAPVLQDLFSEGASFGVVPAGGGGTGLAPGLEAMTVSTNPQMAVSTRLANGGPAVGPTPVFRSRTEGGVRIMANETQNTLLIMATPAEYRVLETALRDLDAPPLQVLVEATVAEVRLTEDLRYGVQYIFDTEIFNEDVSVTLSNAASSAIASAFPGFSAVTGTPVRGVLDALDSITDVNVISSPNLMVMDNQTATLTVGDEVPVAVQAQENALTDDNVIVNSIEFRSTGIIFEVTPRVTHSGAITMDIIQEVSNVAASATPTLTPTISQRRIASSVVVASGETIVLGGLFSENGSKGSSGIPVLSRIPFVGWLFGQRTNNRSRTELVVLISPRIVRNDSDARAVTAEIRSRLRRLDVFSASARDRIMAY